MNVKTSLLADPDAAVISLDWFDWRMRSLYYYNMIVVKNIIIPTT